MRVSKSRRVHVRLLRTIFDEVLTTIIVREVPGATVSERLLCALVCHYTVRLPSGHETNIYKHTHARAQ